MEDTAVEQKSLKEVKTTKNVMTEVEKSIIHQVRMAFYSLGPIHAKLDVRTVLEEKHYRLNWWSQMENGEKSITLSIFVTVVKTLTGFDFINETANEKPYLKRD